MRFWLTGAVLAATALVLAILAPGGSEAMTVRFDGSTPPRERPFVSGVGVHFGIGGEYNYDPGLSAEKIRELGFDSYRDDLPWSLFLAPDEGRLGQRPRRLFDFMQQRAARPLLILGHPNPNVPGGNPPLSEEGQDAFARYAASAVEAMEPFDPIYEIWNEWNMNAVRGRPWLKGAGSQDDPRAAVHYVSLARKSVAAIRRTRPDAEILVGAVGMDENWEWTRSIVEGGALEGADGLSVHLYNHCEADRTRRNATDMVDRLEDLQRFLREWNKGADYPVAVTEYGWPSIEQQCVISREAAADNSAQFMLWASATPWLTGAWVYQLKESLRDPADLESGFGLYDYDYRDKPAACQMREALDLVHGAETASLRRPFANLFLLKITGKNGSRLVAWTTEGTPSGLVELGDGRDLNFRPLCSQEGKGASVTVGSTPVVIDLPSDSPDDIQAFIP